MMGEKQKFEQVWIGIDPASGKDYSMISLRYEEYEKLQDRIKELGAQIKEGKCPKCGRTCPCSAVYHDVDEFYREETQERSDE